MLGIPELIIIAFVLIIITAIRSRSILLAVLVLFLLLPAAGILISIEVPHLIQTRQASHIDINHNGVVMAEDDGRQASVGPNEVRFSQMEPTVYQSTSWLEMLIVSLIFLVSAIPIVAILMIWRSLRASKRSAASAQEKDAINLDQLLENLRKMETRVENLETILLNRRPTHADSFHQESEPKS